MNLALIYQSQVHLKLLISQSKFSGTRKFTLRYQQFGMNLDFDISTVNRTCNFKISVSCGHLIKQAIADETKQGQAAKAYIDKGMMGKPHTVVS